MVRFWFGVGIGCLFMAGMDFLSERDGGEAVGGVGARGEDGGEIKWDQAGTDTGPYHDRGQVFVVIDGVRVMSCPVGQTAAYDPVTGERTKLAVVGEDGE